MVSFARYALFASLVASALGGVAMCVLVVKFGFAPPDDEPVDDRHRRLFATHLGHAFAAVAFALTAMFTVVALLSEPPARLRSGAGDVAALEGRLQVVEGVLRRMERSLTNLAERVASDAAPPASVPSFRPSDRRQP